jgi:hypothetical protein
VKQIAAAFATPNPSTNDNAQRLDNLSETPAWGDCCRSAPFVLGELSFQKFLMGKGNCFGGEVLYCW